MSALHLIRVLLSALVIVAPFAASAPVAYVGRGSGVGEDDYVVPILPVLVTDFERCHAFDALVQIHRVGDLWIPTAHTIYTDEDGLACNFGWRHAVENPIWPVSVTGSPETGFHIDFSSGDCHYSTVDIGPLGPQTDYRAVSHALCSGRHSWDNATLAFEAVG